MEMRIRKSRKGQTSLLVKVFMVVLVIGLVLFIVPGFVKKGADTAKTEQCMRTIDYDLDTYIADDTCQCDPGKIEEQDAYYVNGNPSCIVRVSVSEDGKNSYSWSALVKAEDCEKKLASVARDANSAKPGTCSLSIGVTSNSIEPSKITEESCWDAVLARDPKTGGRFRTCPTSLDACKKRIVESEQCKSQ